MSLPPHPHAERTRAPSSGAVTSIAHAVTSIALAVMPQRPAAIGRRRWPFIEGPDAKSITVGSPDADDSGHKMGFQPLAALALAS
ncbi:hypothetical protein GQ55_7G048200 [Panicum hallii var. hallii]|uniref:Uncharacterized protein n=1 Tax=Panicum hallii var. hallii TaxID=1504633 RepID=A0A2T7CSH9_9POAL|nr:hypothetical protein GQ55_7G048200 [Panicum hallii var. hallii]